MTVSKHKNGKWMCEVYPQGREGKRIRRQFNTKGEAEAFEAWAKKEAQQKPWLGEKADRRRLSELIALWFKLHGQSLAAGKSRMAKLSIICRGLGDPVAAELSAKTWAHYRERRLRGEIDNGYTSDRAKWKVQPVTVNREQQYLSAVFNELKRLGEWSQANPIEGVRVFREKEREMSWLTQPQIAALLAACEAYGNADLTRVVKVCLATGARWREAESLTRAQLAAQKITFIKTKGGRNRTVPVPGWLFEELAPLSGALFRPCYGEFTKMLATTSISLAEGQKTHVLRHTFAAHFMANGGNILVLQRILGHANIRETMRYAHFAPDHLEEAVTLSPLAHFPGGKVAADVA